MAMGKLRKQVPPVNNQPPISLYGTEAPEAGTEETCSYERVQFWAARLKNLKQVSCQKGLRTLLNMWSGPDFFFCDAAVFVAAVDLSEASCLESFEFF